MRCVCWKILTTKLLIWLFSEILLNAIGLDNSADADEFRKIAQQHRCEHYAVIFRGFEL